MGLIATDRVWAPVFCFGVQGFHPNDFLAFSFHYTLKCYSSRLFGWQEGFQLPKYYK